MSSRGDTESSGRDRAPERESELAEVLTNYFDRLNAGEMIHEQEVFRDHPSLAIEILAQLRAFQDFSSSGEQHAPLATLGDYTLRRQIGRGGMGVVYEAWENSMDRAVALKVLPAGIAADPRASARFLREAQTAGRLSHPNVVPVYFTGVREQTPFYAMEYVDGETLARVLARLKDAEPDSDTPFGRKDQVGYFAALASAFADVADGLQHAHSKGVIHRDIKPSNLILDADGHLRILDFGLARLEGQESLTASGDLMGTVLYMSPEQATVKRVPLDHRTDVYSLGATMYEVLTGEPPFRGKDHHDTLSQIIARDPRPPRQLNSRIPKDLETIVLKCLRKDAGDRYGTAEAMGQDLGRFVRGDSVEARPEGTWERTVRHLWRVRRGVAFVGVLALLLAATGLLLASWFSQRRAQSEREYDEVVTRAVRELDLGRPLDSFHSPDLASLQHTTEEYFGDLLWGPKSAVRRRTESAVEDLLRAADTVPWRPEARYHRARGLVWLGEQREAIDELDRALGSSPSFTPARLLLAELLEHRNDYGHDQPGRPQGAAWTDSFLRARAAAQTAAWKLAERTWTEVLMAIPADRERWLQYEARMGRGVARLEQRQMDGAQRDFESARAYRPYDISAAILLGIAYLWEHGGLERSNAWFEEFHDQIKLRHPEYADEVALRIAAVFDGDRAVDWAKRIENDALRKRTLLTTLLWAGQYMEVRDLVTSLGKDDLTDPLTKARSAYAFANLHGFQDRARALADAARAEGGNNSRVLYFVGITRGLLGELETAIECLEQARALDPHLHEAASGLSLGHLLAGRSTKALEVAEAIVRDDPNSFDGWTDVMNAHRLLGHFEKAEEAYEQARAIHERFGATSTRRSWDLLNVLGALRVYQGRYTDAEKLYLEAYELYDRGAYMAALWLGRVYLRQERPDSALIWYVRAVQQTWDFGRTFDWALPDISAILRWKPRTRKLSPLDDLVVVLKKHTRSDHRPIVGEALALALAYAPGRGDIQTAVEVARDVVVRHPERRVALETLASVELERLRRALCGVVMAAGSVFRMPWMEPVSQPEPK